MNPSLRVPIPLILVICWCIQSGPILLLSQQVRLNELSAYPTQVTSQSGNFGEDWRLADFNDSNWNQSVLPLGMDAGSDYQLPVNLYNEMYGQASSLYARCQVEVEADLATSNTLVTLKIDYDDGFILYINGVEVKRSNAGTIGLEPAYTLIADSNHPASNDSGSGLDNSESFGVVTINL